MLEDVLDYGLDVVFCGTATGDRSARLQCYYAGRGNTFWPVLLAVGLTPRVLAPCEYRLLLSYGLGLTDLVKGQSGADRGIRFDESGPQSLHDKILTYEPRILCFNGKTAAKEYLGLSRVEYGEHSETAGRTRLFVCPSTSGAARGYWDISWWRELAEVARSGSA